MGNRLWPYPIITHSITDTFIIGAANARKLSKNQTISGKGQYIRWYSFAWTGVGGMLIAKTFLSQMSQKSAMAFVILAFTILSCIFAVGLLSYQRLYFLKNMLINIFQPHFSGAAVVLKVMS